MSRRPKRLALLAVCVGVLGLAVGLVLYGLSGQITYFYSPTDIASGAVPDGQRIRIGGLVRDGSVVRGAGTLIRFDVTDTTNAVTVVYDGTPPDLFREGQGVVAEGTLDGDGTLVADNLLARHDENYMPAEVVESLKAQGVWEGDGADLPATN